MESTLSKLTTGELVFVGWQALGCSFPERPLPDLEALRDFWQGEIDRRFAGLSEAEIAALGYEPAATEERSNFFYDDTTTA